MPKHVLIFGSGISARSAGKLLLHSGMNIAVADDGDIADPEGIFFGNPRVKLYAQGLEQAPLGDVSQVILSPGIPRTHAAVQAAIKLDISVVTELDLAAPYLADSTLIGVTGTNGKSTTVALIRQVLLGLDPTAVIAGNFGVPLCDYVLSNPKPKFIVCELSSFHLESLGKIRFDMGLITNLSPDHLDRYASLEDYYQSKANLVDFLKPNAPLLLNQDDSTLLQLFENYQGPVTTFTNGVSENINAPAARCAGQYFGATLSDSSVAISTFKGLPHRLEFVGEKAGALYYNDSKATNLAACTAALRQFAAPIHLILGGHFKETSFAPLAQVAKSHVTHIYAVGEAQDQIVETFKEEFQVHPCGTIDQAVDLAHKQALSNEVVLLSPACTSLDQFDNFKRRGEAFVRCFNAL